MKKTILWLLLAAVALTMLPVSSLAAGGQFVFRPTLKAQSASVPAGGTVHLSWNVSGAEYVSLKRQDVHGNFAPLYGASRLPAKMDGYEVKLHGQGEYQFIITAKVGGQLVDSEPLQVRAGLSAAPQKAESTAQQQTKTTARGMDNHWVIRAVICRYVRVDGYNNSFSTAELNHIRRLLSMLPDTLYHLSGGRMTAEIAGIHESSGMITSISGDAGDLIPEKDFSLNRYLTGDTTLVMVFAPLEGHEGTGWLGLGGYTHSYQGHEIYMTEFSSAYANPRYGTWTKNGYTFDTGICAMVHEILHAVELNSHRNGWGGFVEVHDGPQNGYGNDRYGFMDWYSDLMSDTIKNGKKGFRDVSFLVRHQSTRGSRTGQ